MNKGDKVLVSDDGNTWKERTFFSIHDNKYYCHDEFGNARSWPMSKTIERKMCEEDGVTVDTPEINKEGEYIR